MNVRIRCLRLLAWIFGLGFAGLWSSVAGESFDLTGSGWTIALDPTDAGESKGWHQPSRDWTGAQPHGREGWDAVSVPHDYLTDPRYAYVGVAWYRRSIAVPAEAADGRTWRLEFATVFQRCRVWLNGNEVGGHEGGYTPFGFDVTKHLLPGRQNFLVVAVDNRVKFRALPGARSGTTANSGQYPWLNYGGILGDVLLVAHAPGWIAGQRIETVMRADGSAVVRLGVRVRNDRSTPATIEVTANLLDDAGGLLVPVRQQDVHAGPRMDGVITFEITLPAGTYQRWEVDTPVTYRSVVTARTEAELDRNEERFGVREIAIGDAQFLLNGRPIRLAGANRARGHPHHGGIDPDALVEQDLRLMKDAGLRFSRLQHTAPGRNLLDWADREGMLLILEVGMWGYLSEDVASEELRERFRQEMRELVQLAGNHPSVVGWSLGNEYESWTPEGVAWTRDMARFMKELDPTRPVTFAALGRELRELRTAAPEQERAFDYVDLISTNLYFKPSDVPEYLDPVHARWPDKPLLITEYGLRADRVKAEDERLVHFDAMLALVRERPWICGFSYWAFNDYASRYPGTGTDGYRRWGLVDEHRRPRPLYEHVRAQLANGIDAAPGSTAEKKND